MSKPTPLSPKKRPSVVRRGAQTQTIEKVAAQVFAAETAVQQEYESRQVPLSQIRLWEEQPRNTKLTLDDIYRGAIDPTDRDAKKKDIELDSIIGLALSIKELGMLNEPLAYSLPGKSVQLMGGQRRTMAAIFGALHTKVVQGTNHSTHYEVEIDESVDLSVLDLERIAVRCYSKKPDDITLEQIGMADNAQRKDVPVADKLRWLLRFNDRKESLGQTLTWNELVDTMGLNRSQAFKWLKVVKTREDTWVSKVIELVLADKASFNKLIEIADAADKEREDLFNKWFAQQEAHKIRSKVSLGVSTNMNALKTLILNNVDHDSTALFASVNWDKPSDVKKAFAAFMVHWEGLHGE